MWDSERMKGAGFTLLEMLVVMAVSGLILSLAAPPLMDIYQRTRARVELASLRETLAEISLLAFAQSRAARVTLEGREMRLYWVREQTEEWSGARKMSREPGLSPRETPPEQEAPVWTRGFERIFFPPVALLFSPLGYPDRLEVTVQMGAREERLSLDAPVLPHRGEGVVP